MRTVKVNQDFGLLSSSEQAAWFERHGSKLTDSQLKRVRRMMRATLQHEEEKRRRAASAGGVK